MPQMLGTASRELAILWTVRVEHVAKNCGPGVITGLGSNVAPTAGRAHLPSLRRSLPASYSILRPMRPEYAVARNGTSFRHYAYNIPEPNSGNPFRGNHE